MKEHASRAQIFQSFDSLKGFRRQLKLQEKIVVERPLLSEEDLKQLDQRIHRLKPRYARPSHLPRTKRMHPNTGDPVQDQHGHKNFLQIVKTKIPFRSTILSIQGEGLRRELTPSLSHEKRASPGLSCLKLFFTYLRFNVHPVSSSERYEAAAASWKGHRLRK